MQACGCHPRHAAQSSSTDLRFNFWFSTRILLSFILRSFVFRSYTSQSRIFQPINLVLHCPVKRFQSTHLEELNADGGKNEHEEERNEHDIVDGFHRHDYALYHSLKQTRQNVRCESCELHT